MDLNNVYKYWLLSSNTWTRLFVSTQKSIYIELRDREGRHIKLMRNIKFFVYKFTVVPAENNPEFFTYTRNREP